MVDLVPLGRGRCDAYTVRMRGRRFDPRHLDVESFAERAESLDGEAGLALLPRLVDQLRPESMAVDMAPVRWQATGERRLQRGGVAQAWLHLVVEARLAMTCQRCLQPVPVPLSLDGHFRFVADEAAAADEDLDADEDLLPTTRSLDLLALIEDELLMALPIVPRHDGRCPEPLALPADELREDTEETPAKPHPFAALAALKRPGPDQ